jgi:acetate---CoA ligase (ADP-forming)
MDRLDGILVRQQVNDGVEVALGIHRDPEIGLVVMVGSGGIWLELMKDAAFALPPLNRDVARTMLQTTRISRVLAGYRGGHVYDVDAVTDALVALEKARPLD